MDTLPMAWMVVIVFLFGVVIGSFLNVVIYRLHTGKSLNDRSHCLSCGKGLAWYELFPLVSYLSLRGRCSGCSSRIPSRYFFVEFITGCCFVMALLYTKEDLLTGGLLAVICALLIVGTVYDLYHMIIPDEVVIGVTVVGAVFLATYNWPLTTAAISMAVLAGTVASVSYGALWWYSGGRWIGFGDVKLAFPLGLLVGLSGVFTFIVLSFWVGAVVSLVLLGSAHLIKRGQPYLPFATEALTIKSEVPFAPFMVIAFALTFFFGADVLSYTTYVIEALY